MAVLIAIAICLLATFGTLATIGSGDDKAADQAAKSTAEREGSGSGGGTGDSTAGEGASEAVPTKATYKVRAGDSFASIAAEVGVTVETLQELNPNVDPRALQPGERLKLR